MSITVTIARNFRVVTVESVTRKCTVQLETPEDLENAVVFCLAGNDNLPGRRSDLVLIRLENRRQEFLLERRYPTREYVYGESNYMFLREIIELVHFH